MPGEHKINIAIDGYSACGKSTLAQALARYLKYNYVDSGAMYRAVTLYAVQHCLDPEDLEKLIDLLPDIHIDCRWSKDGNKIFLNQQDVSTQIRLPEIQNLVSPVSAIPQIRKFLVAQQKLMSARKGVVMDGRDIGTVVLPDAELKIFMTADIDIRTDRRLKELESKGIIIDRSKVQANLVERDYIDSHRIDSPLRQAEDAILLNNSYLTEKEQFDLALSWTANLI
ncbi:MAG: (d)CMP kinase [Saprospiraceae bacterium]|nr:(d)CMP kinase [Saprospiraceae bacterium]